MTAVKKVKETSLRDKLKNPDMFQTECFINGKWVGAKSGERTDVFNPATGEVIASIPKMGYDETMDAIAKADAAFDGWRKKLAGQRAAIMNKWAQKLRDNRDDIAYIMACEQGKPIDQAKGEIDGSAEFVDWYAAEALRVQGETVQATKAGRRETVWKEPIGVSAAITPWNFPGSMIARKVAPAIAAGCPVVLKPAELTPFTAFAFAKCAEEAGIPAGIFNVVTGRASEIGKAMTESKTVRKLSFTGSTGVGKLLYQQCSSNIKKMSLELGGNAPFIIFEDADMDAVMKGIEIAKFRNTGQTCVCANRIFVHEKVYDEFRDRLVKMAQNLKVGDPTDPKTQVGCLVDEKAFDGVKKLIDNAVKEGAKITTGGNVPKGLNKPFIEPTVIEGVTNDMEIAREEIFGPVATLIKFKDEAEVIKMANDTPYGLAAYYYTQDFKRMFRVGEALEYGMVGANIGHVSSMTAPNGGYKESGLGRESGAYGIEEYLEPKYLCFGEVD
jgi:succinate-semialdehyde dehydrogenase / glutarate-semialdehyde dehydrogenase